TVGSKEFTEGIILGEVIARTLRSSGVDVAIQRELGGTRLVWNALLAGNIDAYAEYTGTLFAELVPEAKRGSFSDLKRVLNAKGIGITRPLGFNNTYGIGMTRGKA